MAMSPNTDVSASNQEQSCYRETSVKPLSWRSMAQMRTGTFDVTNGRSH